MNPQSSEQLQSLEVVIGRTSLKRSSIYAKIAAGDFPPPVKISANRVAWPASRVDAWIASKIAEAA